MNTDEHGLRHCEITQRIIGVFFQVYNELGMTAGGSISGKNRWEISRGLSGRR